MKNQLFLFFFSLLIIGNINSQIPFAPLGTYYCHQTYCPPDYKYPFGFTVTEDTIIQGKYCTKIKEEIGISCDKDPYVHQDGYQVFVYDQALDTFHLVFDFSKKQGESWRIRLCPEWDFIEGVDSATVLVDNVTQTSVGNQPGVKMEIDLIFDSINWTIPLVIYEGIGGTGRTGSNILMLDDFLIAVDCGTKLYCFQTGGNPSVEYFDYPPCPCTMVPTDELINANNYFEIFPNPANAPIKLKYSLPEKIKNAKFITSDIYGKTHQIINIENKEGNITLNKLNAGQYFISLTIEEEIISTKRLIVLD
jgi:hypothetical protein